ncbi:MAG: FtsK/SpoIIIE domain-containing protein [Lacisediminihabitans sp.]
MSAPLPVRQSSARVVLPRLPEPAAPHSFPLVATVAPVIGSVALWALTQSPFAIIFALLGPIVAVASLADTVLQGRRSSRRERTRFTADVAAARAAIVRAHEREVTELARAHQSARQLIAAPPRDPERWRGDVGSPLLVALGTGAVKSSLSLDGDPAVASSGRDTQLDELYEQLRSEASVLRGAPVVVDARLGIGVCGPSALATACARGIVVQLANALSPAAYELSADADGDWSWLRSLPHQHREPAGTMFDVATRSVATGSVATGAGRKVAVCAVEFRERDAPTGSVARVLVAVSETIDGLPRDCRVVLRLGGGLAAELLPHPGLTATGPIGPEFVSEAQARGYAESLSRAAEGIGIAAEVRELPDVVSLESLYPTPGRPAAGHPAADGGRGSLACAPAWGVDGPMTLDLVSDGPHALVGGTTGSGKSELLVSWVLAMAACHTPATVTFLLVDFKGGSSFASVQNLPHSVGLITDLDDRSASRALASLRAELRYRERVLADAGARSIEGLPPVHPLPRLVIVVDEFAAMVNDFPELHELFADLASRGRSLGVHLILCTQRPAGVVRDAVLANCALRISLRVNNRADSAAVIGTGAAAELPRHPLGRALVSVAGAEPRRVQVALSGSSDCARIAAAGSIDAASSAAAPVRRPWCDPLPKRVRLEELEPPATGLAFGLWDLPDEQRQEAAVYDPEQHGNLLVIGGHGSGKSAALVTLSAAGPRGFAERVPGDVEGAWDALVAHLAVVRGSGARARLLLLDDLDALLGRFPEEYEHAFIELLTQLLREGGRVGTHLVLTARRLSATLQPVAALCDSRIVLRLPNRQEHLMAGGEPSEFDADLAPGGGFWRGHRVQIACAPGAAATDARSGTEQLSWDRSPAWAIVSTAPGALAHRLRSQFLGTSEDVGEVIELGAESARGSAELTVLAPGRRRIVVADPEAWQSHWGLIKSLRARMPVLFEGCSVAEFRALSTLRQLPPPILPHSGSAWLLTPDGSLSRARPPWLREQTNRGD